MQKRLIRSRPDVQTLLGINSTTGEQQQTIFCIPLRARDGLTLDRKIIFDTFHEAGRALWPIWQALGNSEKLGVGNEDGFRRMDSEVLQNLGESWFSAKRHLQSTRT
jgi:hypothetical protein